MNKKLISFLLIICMMLSLFPVSAFANGQNATAVPDWGGSDVIKDVTTDGAITFKLNNDVTTGQGLEITSGQAVTLDLNGHTLTLTSENNVPAIIQNAGHLTIKNNNTTTQGTIKATSGSALILENNGKTEIQGANTTFSGTLQNNASGILAISNGVYKADTTVSNAGVVWIYGGTFDGKIENSASIAIEDGTFNGKIENVAGAADAVINIYGGYFKIQPDEAFLAPGYSFVPAADKDGYVTAITAGFDIADPVVTVPEGTPPEVTDAVKTLKPAADTDAKILAQTAFAGVSAADKEAVVAKLYADIPSLIGQTATIAVVPYFDIKINGYDTAKKQLAMDISPMYLLKATTSPNNMVEDGNNKNTVTLGEAKPVTFTNNKITLSLQLPEGFTANYVKHQKSPAEGGAVYYYPVKTAETGISSFEVVNGFSEFTFITDNREGTIDFSSSANYSYLVTYTLESVGCSLPTIQKDNFIGWDIDGKTYTHCTDELLTIIDGRTVKATAKYGSGSSSSGGSSGGGGAAAPRAVVTSPDNDVIITYTGLPINLVNSVEKAVAQNKNVQVVGGSSSSVRISAKKNGAVLNSFSSPFTVTVPVSKAALNTVTDTSKLTLAKVIKAADGKITLTYMGGNYNEAKNNFTAYVDEPGDYVLIADNNVQKIELQVGKKDNTINGRTVTNDAAPVIVNSRTMIPLRFVSESLGGQVSWNEASRTATIKMNGVTMQMTIDQKMEGFDTAPIIKDGRTMVPVRYIAEKLGANVIYVPNTQEIIVVK